MSNDEEEPQVQIAEKELDSGDDLKTIAELIEKYKSASDENSKAAQKELRGREVQFQTAANWGMFMQRLKKAAADPENITPVLHEDGDKQYMLKTMLLHWTSKEKRVAFPAVEVNVAAADSMGGDGRMFQIAQSGCALIFSDNEYRKLRQSVGAVEARNWMRKVTAHNGKFQINYSVKHQRYEVSKDQTAQYRSGYLPALTDLASKVTPNQDLYKYAHSALEKARDPPENKFVPRPVNSTVTMAAFAGKHDVGLKHETDRDQLLSDIAALLRSKDSQYKQMQQFDNKQFEQLEQELAEKQHSVQQLQQQLQNIKGNIAMPLDKFIRLQQHTAQIVQHFVSQAEQNPSQRYLLGMLDAELGKGTRIPMMVPEPTATYQTFLGLTRTFAANEEFFIIGNHCAARSPTMFTFQGASAANLLDNVPFTVGVYYNHVVLKGSSKLVTIAPDKATFLATVKPIQSAYDSTLFSAVKLVSSTLKVFKESKAETESGHAMVGMYRQGFPIGDQKLRTYMERSSINQRRIPYSSSENDGPLLAMHSYRPTTFEEVQRFYKDQDMLCSTYLEQSQNVSSLRVAQDFTDQAVLFAVFRQDDLGLGVDEDWRIMSYDAIVAMADKTNVAIAVVLDSINQPQTFAHHYNSLNAGATIRVEVVSNFEGTVDRENTGLDTQICVLPSAYTSAIDLCRRIPIEHIVQNYDMLMGKAIQSMQPEHFGEWYTIFTDAIVQTAQDIARWALNKVKDPKSAETIANVVEDAILAAVLAVAPEMAPLLTPIIQKTSDYVQKAITRN